MRLSGGAAAIINCTITGNSGTYGGGIYNNVNGSTGFTISNSILAGNSGDYYFPIFGDPSNYPNLKSLGHNIFGSVDAPFNWSFTGTGDLVASGISPINPLLGPLADNGGPTLTHALLVGSPAINAGDNTIASNAGLTTDQRGPGFPRIGNGGTTVDAGAFEADNTTMPLLAAANNYTTTINTTISRTSSDPDDLLDNDILSSPQATLTSFGGGSLGGTVTTNAAGTSVALAGGTLVVNSDGSFSLTTPSVVGAFTFRYRISNTSGTSDAQVTIKVLYVCPATGTRWYVNAAVPVSGTGTSWDCAFQILQEALAVAGQGHEIWVAKGTYKPTASTDRTKSFSMRNGLAIYGGFIGTETLLSQRNATLNETILSGDIGTPGLNTDNSYQVIYNNQNALNSSAILDGFTITQATNSGMVNTDVWHDTNISPTISNCIFTGNTSNQGGGLYNLFSSPTLINCIFYSNTSSVDGGAIYNIYQSSPKLINCTFYGNSAAGNGGAMFSNGQLGGYLSPSITNCIFWGNNTGIFNVNDATPTISYSIVQGGCPVDATCSNVLNVDPLFVSTTNLRLQTTSPAINAGTNTGAPENDIDGNIRLLTVADPADMGAYENKCQTIIVSNPVVTTGNISTAFSQTFTSTGGAPTVTYTTSSTLPTGITLSSSGLLSGTPTQLGTFPIVVTATGGNGCTGIGTTYYLTINCIIDPIVTTNADSGPGSLRQAIFDACPNSVITFDMTTVVSPIILTSGQLSIVNKSLTIQGPGLNLLTINGNNSSRIFYLNGSTVPSPTYTISGLTITGGHVFMPVGGSSPDGQGGGIYNGISILILTDVAVTGNTADVGGGIQNGGSINLQRCIISGNTATGFGGGINHSANFPQGSTIYNSTISGNTCGSTQAGAGICSIGDIFGGITPIAIINSTISGNIGGGIWLAQGGSVIMTYCTVTGNSGFAFGGGILMNPSSGAFKPLNSIIAGNTAPSGPDAWGTKVISQGFNLVGNIDGSSTWDASDIQGTIANPVDALLGSLENNGGPTKTHKLLTNSPALDKGKFVVGISTDQRGVARPFDNLSIANAAGGDGSDIGAYEGTCPTITPVITGELNFCDGTSSILNAGDYNSYIWSTNETTQTITVNTAGAFTVTVTDANGCTGSATVTTTLKEKPNAQISGDISFCNGSSTQLCGNGGAIAYLWSTGETSQCITVTDANNYSVTITNIVGCTGSTSVTTIVKPNPTPIISGTLSFCPGSSTTLYAGKYFGYNWSTLSTSQTISVNTAGTFTVTVSDQNGCTGSTSVTTIVNPNPTPSISGTLSFCNGSSTTLDAGIYSAYVWSSLSTSQTISVNTVGAFSVVVTDLNGCTGSASVTTIINPNPTPTIRGNLSFCSGSSTTLNAGAYAGYLWSTLATTQMISVNTAGIFSVKVTDGNGCTGSASVTTTLKSFTIGAISGLSGACAKQSGLVYCVTNPTPGIMYYIWTLPTGVSAIGATTGACITLKFSSKFKGGPICAKAVTPCGNTPNSCMNVVLITKTPNTPGTINGPLSICPNAIATYSIIAVPNATNYLWSVPSNMQILSGQGSISVIVKALSNFNSGYVKVRAMNCKDGSGTKSMNLVKSRSCKESAKSIFESTIESDLLTGFSVYPNPTSGKLTITFISVSKTKVKLNIMDLLGKNVLMNEVEAVEGTNTKQIDLTHLAKGMYFISFVIEGMKVQPFRIVVE